MMRQKVVVVLFSIDKRHQHGRVVSDIGVDGIEFASTHLLVSLEKPFVVLNSREVRVQDGVAVHDRPLVQFLHESWWSNTLQYFCGLEWLCRHNHILSFVLLSILGRNQDSSIICTLNLLDWGTQVQ